jgi:hypothetical protein
LSSALPEKRGCVSRSMSFRGEMHGDVRKLDGRERRDRDDDRDGENVPDRQRYDCANDGNGAAFLKADRNREEPAHSRIEAVIAA